jgi:hypothetical protein
VFYEKGGESDGSFAGGTFVGRMIVRGNIIQNNGLEGNVQRDPAIAVYSSKNVLIENNIFGGNVRAVTASVSDARLNDDKHGWPLSNVVIQNNTLNGDVIVGCMTAGVQCSGNV